ncbi:MAG: peptidase M49 [Planctomycetes bacterium]|nr:peptidase M49 [Planctomycetota bacterium]MBL7040883.1 peptidase M49 [Pirellulaceae bacterium]
MTARQRYLTLSFALLIIYFFAKVPRNAGAANGCGEKAATSTADDGRKYLLERVDDVAIVQLYVNGFERLPLRQRILIYHLSEAAIAGRDIFIDQKYKHSLEIRDLIEEVLTNSEGIEAKTLAEIRRYTKLFWVNNGPHSAVTSRKYVLNCSPEDFVIAVKKAEANGADLPKASGESTGDLLARMEPLLFDPTVDSHVTNKSPGPGQDILQASANNFYEGVTLKDLEGFDELYALNSKLTKRPDGTLEEIIWRAGFDDVVPPGMYADEINAIVGHMEAAIPFATPKMARALGALVQYYRTGSPIDFRAYNIAWVADDDSPVDTINGFIEVYVDPRGQKGAFEGIVYYDDPEKMDMIRRIAENAQWFEDRMPFDSKYRKPKVKGISAKAIQAVMETGDAGPVTPIGINLPNPGDIRELYGSKSVSLSNVIEAYDKASTPAARREFCYDDGELDRATKWKSLALDLEVNMHEVIGHASGRVSDQLQVDPSVTIGEYYSALEETRADLVALWFIGDKKLAELGLVAEEDRAEIERAAYEAYTRNAMSQLRRVREGDRLEEDHMRNRQLIVHWLMDNTDSIEVRHEEGKTYYVVLDIAQWKRGVGRLLAEVQRIKSEGDRKAAADLLEAHGIKFDPKLRGEVVDRYKKLDRPSYAGFVMPELTAVRDGAGTITDVKISYPMDIEKQMLGWSGRL